MARNQRKASFGDLRQIAGKFTFSPKCTLGDILLTMSDHV
jgi:hypothetical protein